MSELQRLLSDPLLRAAGRSRHEPIAAPDADLGVLLRVVSSSDEQASPLTRRSPPQDWDALIQRVHAAAKQARGAEAQAREREARIEQVLERVREDIQASNERVRAAEAHARDADVRAEARVMAAEERVRAAEARAEAAEERARHAEGWLAKVQEALTSEFADLTTDHAA